jgi:hypothetical protein
MTSRVLKNTCADTFECLLRSSGSATEMLSELDAHLGFCALKLSCAERSHTQTHPQDALQA